MPVSDMTADDEMYGASRKSRGAAKVKLQRYAYVTLLLAALTLAGLAVELLQAGIASQRAERYLQHAQKLDPALSEQARHKAYEAIRRAVERYPVANGEYLDRLGRVIVMQAEASEAEASSRPALEESRDVFRASLAERPLWPWTWLRLAHSKVLLGEFDEELDMALNRANELGRGHADIDRDMARLGFFTWADLSASQRRLTLAAAGRAASHSRQDAELVYGIAKQTGRSIPFCWSLEPALKTQQRICKEDRQ